MTTAISLIEKAEHALGLLDDVVKYIPGTKGVVIKMLVDNVRKAVDFGGIKEELERVLAANSAEAQAIADTWPSEPTKPE